MVPLELCLSDMVLKKVAHSADRGCKEFLMMMVHEITTNFSYPVLLEPFEPIPGQPLDAFVTVMKMTGPRKHGHPLFDYRYLPTVGVEVGGDVSPGYQSNTDRDRGPRIVELDTDEPRKGDRKQTYSRK